MRWFRDTKSLVGTWLCTLVMLGLVFAIVAETPLRAVGGLPAWLTLGGTSTGAGSMSPPPAAPGEPALAAAAERKGDKQDKGTDKSDQKAEKSDKRKGGKRKHPGEDKGRTPGGGNGKHQGDGKRDTPQRDNGQGDKQITQERKGKDKTSERRGAADIAAADVAAADVTAAATSLSFTPVADAQVIEANPSTNYGDLLRLTVDGGTDPQIFSYLRFSVSGVSGTVQRATLRLWVQDSDGGGTQDGPFVKKTGTNWSETGITWQNRPGAKGGVLDDKGALARGTWVEYDVTSAVKGNGAVGFTLRPQTSDAAAFDSREGTKKPQLVITLGSGTPSPTPTPTPGPTPPGSNVSFPVRATFYYPWFPNAWKQGTVYPYTNYQPSLGYYDGGDTAIIKKQIAAMQYGGISVGIASWWGVGHHTDQRIPALLSAAAGTGFRWALYYEPEGYTDLSVEQLRADLTYIRDHYGSDPSYARVDGKFVVFVYNANDNDCTVADRWTRANTVGAYVVLKVFSGYRTCTTQPNSWHQYSPASATDSQAGYAYAISPGFWLKGQEVRLARDLPRWQQNVRDMVASGAPWQLVTTFNEWGEGTSVESAVEWESSSGYGAYLDALHRNGQP